MSESFKRGTQPWPKLYKTARWHRIREQQLSEHPLCQRCLDGMPKRITPATVVHHINRHHGDPVLFYTGPFASSCAPCHDSIEQGIERRGYDTTIGQDGWPTDQAHPVFHGKQSRRP
jgi:5-methylcytosine-specific restriction protein A